MSENSVGQLRIGWVGFHQEGEKAFLSLLKKGYRIECVITLSFEALEKRSGWIDYVSLCERYEIPVLRVTSINEPYAIEWLKSYELDLLLVIGWSQILRREVLEIPRIAAIGAHASLLPDLRGSAPINWAIIRGLTRTGNSLIQLDEHVDEGRVLDQEAFDIAPFDTCSSLYDKVAETNVTMLLRTLPHISGVSTLPGFVQPKTTEENLPRRRPEDGKIAWYNSAHDIYNLIRAVTRPYPGAFCYLDGKKILIWHSCLLPIGGCGASSGTIVGQAMSTLSDSCGQVVSCGDGNALLLLDVELEGGERLTGPELAKQNWSGKVLG